MQRRCWPSWREGSRGGLSRVQSGDRGENALKENVRSVWKETTARRTCWLKKWLCVKHHRPVTRFFLGGRRVRKPEWTVLLQGSEATERGWFPEQGQFCIWSPKNSFLMHILNKHNSNVISTKRKPFFSHRRGGGALHRRYNLLYCKMKC